MLTAWLIRRRDAAADGWVLALTTNTSKRRAHRRLVFWDVLLGIWTRGGTRRV